MAKTSDNRYIRESIENLQTNEITISEDKLKIKLIKHVNCIRKGHGFLSYLGMCIACVGIVLTADLKQIWIITPDMWRMLFIIASLVFFALMIRSGFFSVFKKSSIDNIVTDIKTADSSVEESHSCSINRLFNRRRNDFEIK